MRCILYITHPLYDELSLDGKKIINFELRFM
jgi:hypothetical protein